MQQSSKQSLHTRVLVAEHAPLEELKQAVKLQRSHLVFKPAHHSSGLHTTSWQGILFQDDRAVGKLCSPRVSITPLLEDAGSSLDGAPGTAIQQCSLAFESWVPAGSSPPGRQQQPLRIPVDADFKQGQLSVQVIGRQQKSGGGGSSSFALPHRYSVHGRDLAAQLQLELQRQGYIRRHQAARSAAGQPSSAGSAAATAAATTSTVTVGTGGEVERLLSVFEVGEKPAWLRSLVCKFLVAEAPAEPAPAVGPAPPLHAARPTGREEEGSGGGSSSRVSSPQGRQPTGRQQQQPGRRRQAAGRTTGAVEEQQQPPRGESDLDPSTPCDSSQSEAQSLEDAASPQRGVKKKKGKRAKAKMPGEQPDVNSPAAAAAAAPAQADPPARPAAAVAAAAANEGPTAGVPSPQAQGNGQPAQQRRPARETEPWSPTAGPGKARSRPQRLPPPPGLRLQSQAEKLPERLPGRADAPGRWRKPPTGGKGPHRGPPAGASGSSSDISSEAAPSTRPGSTAALSSCCSSPEPADPPTPAAASATAAGAAPAASTPAPSPVARRALDSPAALRELAESLLPQEKKKKPEPPQQPGSPAPHASSSCGGAVAADAAEADSAYSGGEQETPPAVASVPLPVPLSPTAAPPAASMDVASSEAAPSASPPSSTPSTPRSSGPALSDSMTGYPSSATSSSLAMCDSPRRQFGMPYAFSSQGWSADSSCSSFQRLYDRQAEPAKPHNIKAQDYPRSASQSDGSISSWSQHPIRLAAPAAAAAPSPAHLSPYSRPLNAAAASWQQQDQCRSYGSPAPVSSAGARPASGQLCGSLGSAVAAPVAPALRNGARPSPYQQHCYQQQFLQLQHQHQQALAAALGGGARCSTPPSAPGPQVRQHRFDPGYQQQPPWQAAGGAAQQQQTYWSDGYSSGYSQTNRGGHGQASQQPGARQWQPASAPSSRCASLATSPVAGKPLSPPPYSVPAPRQLSLPAEPLQLQVVDSPEDGPDLERFLHAVTPVVELPGGDAGELTLADVWRFYEVPSLFGQEVVTLGGPRGPAASYYLPYLSAVQLFVPAAGPAAGPSSSAADAAGRAPPQTPLYSYPGGLDEWPEEMRLQFQWFAGGHVGERIPLGAQLDQLCGGAGAAHPLLSTRIADLHPYSWWAVAWYPLYRIPEAPLDGRFLTYHSLASLWDLAREAQEAAAAVAAPPSAAASPAAAEAPAPQPCGFCPPLSPFAAAAPHGGMPAGVAASASTPTGVCSFPASPTCSDSVATRTTSCGGGGSSAPRSELGSAGSAHSAGGCASGSGSITPPPSPAGSELGDPESPRGSGVAALAQPVRVPVVGLQWYTMPRSVENWVQTLVAAQMPEDMAPAPGTVLADGSHVLGCWRGVAVVAKRYPAAKGGDLAWEVQLEELAETAGRLATGAGLRCRAPGADRAGPPPPQRCPDHEFFSSRAWTCRSSQAAAAARWGRPQQG